MRRFSVENALIVMLTACGSSGISDCLDVAECLATDLYGGGDGSICGQCANALPYANCVLTNCRGCASDSVEWDSCPCREMMCGTTCTSTTACN